MSASLRQDLLDIFVGRATRRYGLSNVNQLQHALQAATPDFDHFLCHVKACRIQ